MALLGARYPGRTVAVLDSCFSYSVHAVLQPDRGEYQGSSVYYLRIVRRLRKACRNLETTHIRYGPCIPVTEETI